MCLRPFTAVFGLSIALLLSACAQAPLPQPATVLAGNRPQTQVRVGAWRALAVDAEIRALADYAAASLGDSGADPLVQVVSAQAQQVAGVRYALVLQLQSGSRWRVGLFRDADGLLQIINRRRL